MQKFPYYSINRVEGGILVKLFKNKHFKTKEEALNAFNKWKDKHPEFEGQCVILYYTSYYTSRICTIFEGNTITWLD